MRHLQATAPAEALESDALTQDDTQIASRPPFRRQVFFISGFDPRGVLFLHKNCVTETTKWSELSGFPVKTGARKNLGKLVRRWTIDAELPDGASMAQVDFLQWDDIIRAHWEKRNWVVYLQSVVTTFDLMITGVYTRTIRESWPVGVTMSVPAATAILHGLGGLFAFIGLLGLYFFGGIGGKIAAVGLIAIAAALIFGIRFYMERFKPEWNGRIGIFATKMSYGKDSVPGLDERLDQMAEHVIATIEADRPDEALIVGHSFGTSLASLVASRVLAKRPEWGRADGPLTLVTLGSTQALIGFMPRATWFRGELARFAAFPDFKWLDITAPPDGACYALINILEFLPDPPEGMPKLLNAQFHRSFSDESMAIARKFRMLMHFYYMQSPDIPQIGTNHYDFILLLAGTEAAVDRFADRPCGKPFFRKD